MKIGKQVLSLGIAGVLAAAAPLAAYAASPEFARTAEEWARLRDNVIEYDELEDLIQEYNVTVQTNQLDLSDFRQKYGNTKDDVSSKYQDLANEIYASVDYPDADDPTYGYVVASVLMAEVQAKNLEQQADDNLEDSEIIYLTYKQAEKTLVTVAQTNMINYESSQLGLEQARIALEQAQTTYSTTQTRQAVGTATQVEVLNALEAVQTAQRNIGSEEAGIENVRQKLQVMLGWKYNDTPEIQKVPASDMNRIAAMNPQADKEKALETNYTLMINKKKLANAGSTNTKESLERTIADNERKIASALETNYQNVLAAKLAYDQAVADLEFANRTMQTMTVQYQQGDISKNDYENQQYTVRTKELAVQIADLNLFQAMETYDWSVNGLASAS